MADLFGLDADVFYGDAEKPLPNWREEPQAAEGAGDEASPEEKRTVASLLGFDPSELWPAQTPPKVPPSPFLPR